MTVFYIKDENDCIADGPFDTRKEAEKALEAMHIEEMAIEEVCREDETPDTLLN